MPHRPTRDADLLGFGPDDIESAVATFREICQITVEDGIVFDPDSVKCSLIRKEAGYGGVRIDLRATLDGARMALQVDIGFGDAVTPAPQAIGYPVLLSDLPAPAAHLPQIHRGGRKIPCRVPAGHGQHPHEGLF